jgi:hypothetical protein
MEYLYHKKLGMIKDTPENRKLFPVKKSKKINDTIKAKSTKQDSGNVDGTIDGTTTV